MKKQKRRIVGGFLVLVMCAGMSLNAGAVTIDEAEKKADQLEQQKESAEAEKQKLTLSQWTRAKTSCFSRYFLSPVFLRILMY